MPYRISILLAVTLLAGCATGPREHADLAPPRAMAITPVKAERPVVALVLGAGGSRGFAHVGVIKVLEAAAIEPAIVVGSSSGSVVAALYAGGYRSSALEAMALRVEDHELIDITLLGPSRVEGAALQHYVNRALGYRPIEDLERAFAVRSEEHTSELQSQ